eukprot:TRINITY_DN7010_c0_g1_i1.p1 TRINITY_DN7010_c0_g1~~TRINITY_DN7010_c0_g1_i1.p1  ORF type:complete len:513 (+),score=89.57 TRINITY_DN7010_c0_g1_i1:30-1568(+)
MLMTPISGMVRNVRTLCCLTRMCLTGSNRSSVACSRFCNYHVLDAPLGLIGSLKQQHHNFGSLLLLFALPLLALAAPLPLELDDSAFSVSASNREIRLLWNDSIAVQCGKLNSKSFVNRWDMNLDIPLTDTLLAAKVTDRNLSFRVIDNLVYQTRLTFDHCTFNSSYITTLLLPQVLIKVYQDGQGTQRVSLDQSLIFSIDSWNLTIEGVSEFPHVSPDTTFQTSLEPSAKYVLTACFSFHDQNDCVREELITNPILVPEAKLDSEVCYGNGKTEIIIFEGSHRMFALWKMPQFSFSGYYTNLQGTISCVGRNISFEKPFEQNGCVFEIPSGDCQQIDLYATGPLQNLSSSGILTNQEPIIDGPTLLAGCSVIPQQDADFATKSEVLVIWNPTAVDSSQVKISLANSSILMEKQVTSTVGSFSFNYHWYDQPNNDRVTVKFVNKNNQEISSCTLPVPSRMESSKPPEITKSTARSSSIGWIAFGVIAGIAALVVGYFVKNQSNSNSGYQIVS